MPLNGYSTSFSIERYLIRKFVIEVVLEGEYLMKRNVVLIEALVLHVSSQTFEYCCDIIGAFQTPLSELQDLTE